MSELDHPIVWASWVVAYAVGAAIGSEFARRRSEKSRKLRDFLRDGR